MPLASTSCCHHKAANLLASLWKPAVQAKQTLLWCRSAQPIQPPVPEAAQPGAEQDSNPLRNHRTYEKVEYLSDGSSGFVLLAAHKVTRDMVRASCCLLWGGCQSELAFSISCKLCLLVLDDVGVPVVPIYAIAGRLPPGCACCDAVLKQFCMGFALPCLMPIRNGCEPG